jgi:hypothetical protein
MLVQDERGRFAALADRGDRLDDLLGFWKVVGDPDGFAAMTFVVNDFATRRFPLPVACSIAKEPKQTRRSLDWSVLPRAELRIGTKSHRRSDLLVR